jgi:outer membrane lipoprotein SlyB
MKKSILSIFSVIAIMVAIVAVMASCSGKRAELGDKTVLMPVDTSGLAQFQAWKAQQITSPAVATMNKPSKTYAARTSSSKKSAKTQTGSMSTSNEYPAKTKPKGWSKSAKGAAIGAGGGAVLGAVINKRNRAVGAVIGGVAGGAVGYGIGRHMDKKDGRY